MADEENKLYVKRETEKKWRIIQDWASNMNPTPGPTSFRRTPGFLSQLRDELGDVKTLTRPSPLSMP